MGDDCPIQNLSFDFKSNYIKGNFSLDEMDNKKTNIGIDSHFVKKIVLLSCYQKVFGSFGPY